MLFSGVFLKLGFRRQFTDIPMSSNGVELVCTPCTVDNKQEKATGYCEVCNEYLCATCEDCHRKFRISRSHYIRKGSDIPFPTSARSDIACAEVCKIHPEECIEYMCHDHNVLCCGACTLLVHRSCSVAYIPEIAKTLKDTEEYKTLLCQLDATGEKLDKIRKKIQKYGHDTEALHSKIMKDIHSFRAEINSFIDIQEQILLERNGQLKKQNESVIEEMDKRETKTRQCWLGITRELMQHKDQLSQLFIMTKRTEPVVTRLKAECDDILKGFQIQEYTFRPCHSLTAMLREGTGLGELLPVIVNDPTLLLTFK